MNSKKNNDFSAGSFLLIAIFFATGLWPLGIGLLLYKLGVFDIFRSGGSRSSLSQETARQQKYKLMSIGSQALSIEHMASAVGISFESCLREVQKMVASGDFGKNAYINYVDKTLVLTDLSRQNRQQNTRTSSSYSTTYSGVSKTPVHYSSGRTGGAPLDHKAAQYTAPAIQEAAGSKVTQSASSAKKPEPTAQQQKKNREKEINGDTPVVLLAIGALLILSGTLLFTGALGDILTGVPNISGLLAAISMLIGGGVSIAARIGLKRRAQRIASYLVVIGGRDYVELRELCTTCGVKEKTLKRDIEVMLEKGLLGETAYVDQGNGILILKPGAAPAKEAEPEAPTDDEGRYRQILREIRKVNDDIPDPDISARIDEMEDLTAKIFKAVQDKPERLPQIKSFMSYYLPTALKLLHSYAEFDSAGAEGDNVKTAKADIERILDMLVEGFRKQLDKLYESDAMDITTDINVLENMLKRDGLNSDGSEFGQVLGGH